MNIQEIADKFEVDVYPRRDLVLIGGKGSKLYDEFGREYIDCASNIGVSNIGHGNKEVAKAIYEQYMKLANCYSMFYNGVRASLAKKLAEITPGDLNRIFFCNSGSEAVETAIKFARTSTGKSEIICAMRGFHGKTMGSLAATWDPELKKPFLPMLPGFVHIPFNNYEKLKSSINENTAGIMLEVIQGEGGIRIGNKDFFRDVRKICDENGILLIIDEVQTGFGRTGKMFACEHYVVPDILCLAKSIAGGVPMGAVVCNNKINIPKKGHTSTFGGNPLACAAALASIEFIESEDLPDRAAESGEYFLARLKEIESPKIKEIRGLGLMIGIELNEKAGPFVHTLMEKGIIVLLAGKYVIRLLPPLIINREEIDYVVETLREIVSC
jgi:acetylornithine/LysW-gamma-L-lysine aminotransferase